MKYIIDIPEIPKNDKQRWVVTNGTPYACGEWIPCSERLPEHGGFFLITNIDELVRLDFFRKSTNDFDNYSAIAWMPLPKPYEKEGENNGQ